MNRHAAYVREIPASRCAVLFVHGILGTPRFFDFLLPDIPPDWTVHNVLLSGHGGSLLVLLTAALLAWSIGCAVGAKRAQMARYVRCGYSSY